MNQTNKKSMALPEEIPHYQELINGTTPEVKSEAEILFDKIGTGKEHALKRQKHGKVDRQLRRLIEIANKNGDCIINLGEGYYRPSRDEEAELDHYLWAELHRAEEIRIKADAMRESYYGRY